LPDGSIRWEEWIGRALFDEDGDPVEFQSLGRDVTERKLAERALADSERRFRSIFNNAAVGAALVDKDGRVVDANEADCSFLGYAKEELVGMHFTEFTHPEDLDLDQHLYDSLVRGERDEYTIDKRYFRKGGDVAWGRLGVSLIRDEAGNPQYTVVMCEDITERKRAEEDRRRLEAQIQHAQKLESLGVMAGGIAHDFNNLLMGVLGNADLALATMAPETPGRHYLEKIETAATRAAELTNQMLAYSGKGRFLVERIQLNRVVEEMAHLLRTVISKKAALKFDFTRNLPAIEADASQIRQIVMNLITNASEAIGDTSGVIGLGTGVVEADRKYLSATYLDDELPAGEYVYLEVSDSGSGMDDETLRKIFDPFFTTKFTGRGLGLAAVLGIVRGHQGAIKVCTEPGRGTSFKVLFPQSGDAPAAREGEPERAEAAHRETTILIVDDDEGVLDVAKTMLQRNGHTVLTAVDGRQGVELYRRHADEIDLVLLDMTMPQMDGEEAFGELRRIRSDVRVILSSGYSEQDATNRFAGKGLAGFIQKPYRSAKLLDKVREALD
jgi:PAS domain S-box-containing protein